MGSQAAALFLALILSSSICLLAQTDDAGQKSRDKIPGRPVLQNSRKLCFQKNRFGRMIKYISDQQTKCWYYQCSGINPIAVRCGLGTFVSEFYEGDDYNPCTERYSLASTAQFDCTRKGFDDQGLPTCIKRYTDNGVCQNGGSVTYQGNLCWCACPSGYSGWSCEQQVRGSMQANAMLDNAPMIEHADSKPTTARPASTTSLKTVTSRVLTKPISFYILSRQSRLQSNKAEDAELTNSAVVRAAPSAPADVSPPRQNDAPAVLVEVAPDGRFISRDPCPNIRNGIAPRDWCAEVGGCFNGGSCVNQCTTFFCMCRPPYTAGRRCETYHCMANVECMNGGTCSRGDDGIDEVATCACAPGFTGAMCEKVL